MKRLLHVIALLMCLFSSFALADAYTDGDALYQKKQYKEAFPLFQKAAKEGNSNAQLTPGSMYEKGHGVKKDYVKAVTWYRKAAEQGHVQAKEKLAQGR